MIRICSIDSVIDSGQDFYNENGKLIGYSVNSSISGQDYFDANSQDVVFCGQHHGEWTVFFTSDGRTGYSVDCIWGSGQSFYLDDGTAGFSVKSPLDGGIDIFRYE